MLKDEIQSVFLQRSTKKLRQFGWVIGIVLVLLFLYFLLIKNVLYFYLTIAGIGFLIVGSLRPSFLTPLYLGWMTLATVLGYFMTRLILSVLFFAVFTPTGLILRILKKDILNEKMEPDRDSYWIKREEEARDSGSLENQF